MNAARNRASGDDDDGDSDDGDGVDDDDVVDDGDDDDVGDDDVDDDATVAVDGTSSAGDGDVDDVVIVVDFVVTDSALAGDAFVVGGVDVDVDKKRVIAVFVDVDTGQVIVDSIDADGADGADTCESENGDVNRQRRIVSGVVVVIVFDVDAAVTRQRKFRNGRHVARIVD
jgi:hypothetical protein